MGSQYAGNNVFPVSANIPDDTDAGAGAVAFAVPYETAFDRTIWLKNRSGNFALVDVQALATSNVIPLVATTSMAGGLETVPLMDSSNGWTTTTASFTQPAVLSTASVQVGSTAWMTVGQAITIVHGGAYLVQSITNATHAVLQLVTAEVAPAGTVTSAGLVFPTERATLPGDIVELELMTSIGVYASASLGGTLSVLLQFMDSQNLGAAAAVSGVSELLVPQSALAATQSSPTWMLPVSMTSTRKITTGGSYGLSLSVGVFSGGSTAGYVAIGPTDLVATFKVWRPHG